jgi:beta-glucosidase
MLSIRQAIEQELGERATIRYTKGCDYKDLSKDGFAEAVAMARASQVAVVVVGGKSGLSGDCTCGELRDRASLSLLGVQAELVAALLETGTPLVLVIVDGRPAAIPELAERIPAILQAWLPGEEGGPAVADLLFGSVSPSGKLPVSVPRSVGQVPLYYGHKPSGGSSYNFVDYVDESVQPLYPFGHGLSYTTFEYRDISISPERVGAKDEVRIGVTVTNTGRRTGAEVVQLYLRDTVASVTRPVKELKGFLRLHMEPSEARRVTFTLHAEQVAFYNLQMQLMLEPGKIEVMLGSSSEDIRLRGEFEIIGTPTAIQHKVFFSSSAIRAVEA